jgi:cell division septal protein FtsQ
MRKDETKRRIKAFILSKQFFIALMVLMCVLALISVVSVFLRFLGVGSFEIKGETSYKLSEIVSVSGIRSGDAMYSINESEAQERILKRCPFLKSVKVKKSFPNKVVFELEYAHDRAVKLFFGKYAFFYKLF